MGEPVQFLCAFDSSLARTQPFCPVYKFLEHFTHSIEFLFLRAYEHHDSLKTESYWRTLIASMFEAFSPAMAFKWSLLFAPDLPDTASTHPSLTRAITPPPMSLAIEFKSPASSPNCTAPNCVSPVVSTPIVNSTFVPTPIVTAPIDSSTFVPAPIVTAPIASSTVTRLLIVPARLGSSPTPSDSSIRWSPSKQPLLKHLPPIMRHKRRYQDAFSIPLMHSLPVALPPVVESNSDPSPPRRRRLSFSDSREWAEPLFEAIRIVEQRDTLNVPVELPPPVLAMHSHRPDLLSPAQPPSVVGANYEILDLSLQTAAAEAERRAHIPLSPFRPQSPRSDDAASVDSSVTLSAFNSSSGSSSVFFFGDHSSSFSDTLSDTSSSGYSSPYAYHYGNYLRYPSRRNYDNYLNYLLCDDESSDAEMEPNLNRALWVRPANSDDGYVSLEQAAAAAAAAEAMADLDNADPLIDSEASSDEFEIDEDEWYRHYANNVLMHPAFKRFLDNEIAQFDANE
jgi:hypothetical protein